jgi:hypothetical protein
MTLDYINPMSSLSFYSIHIGLHTLILYLSLIRRIWVRNGLVMLSPIVLTRRTSLYDIEFGLC